MAGALGVRLGGRNVYRGRVEVRPTLGRGPLPGPMEIRRAARISRTVGALALGASLAAVAAKHAATPRATTAHSVRSSRARAARVASG